jgi:hypothetical protein
MNSELAAQIASWGIDRIKFGETARGTVWTRQQRRNSHKIGFLGIPKNASSVLRLQLQLTQFANIHDIPPDYFIFTIIREPISRFISAYIEVVEKCVHYPEGRYHVLQISPDQIEFLDDLMANYDDYTRFTTYLDKIQYEWGFFEGHCTPQVIYLTDEDGKLQPVHIFKINALKNLERLLASKSSFKINLNPQGSEWTNNSTSNPLLKQKLLDYVAANPKIKRQIEELYEYDFVIWNSNVDTWK